MTQLLYTKDKEISKNFIKNKGVFNKPTGMFEEPQEILIINVDNTPFSEINKIMDKYFHDGGLDIILESDDFFTTYSDLSVLNRGLLMTTN